MEIIMAAPLTLNTDAKTDISIIDSCNCCIPTKRRHRRKKNHVEHKTETVASKVKWEGTPEFQEAESSMDSPSDNPTPPLPIPSK